MKNNILILAICLLPLISMGENVSNDSPSLVIDIDKHIMVVEFLKEYNQDFSITRWKIKIKENKVVLKRKGSLERLTLFNNYFITKKYNMEGEMQKSSTN